MKQKNILAIIALVLLCLAAYHNCFNNAMFWDDDDFILKNRYIKDWKFFPQFFSENLVAGGYLLSNYWRPALLTVFAWAWHAWGLWLPGWHSLNIVFHSLDGILLFFLIQKLFNTYALSLIVALLFVAHPTHNEAIVYVNSLGDSLATFFTLSSLLLFVRFRQSQKPAYKSRNFYFSFLCFPMAIMSKETGFVLCGLLPMMDFLLHQKEPSFWKRAQKTLQTVWPYIFLGIIYIFMRGTVLNFNNSFNFYNEQNEFTSNIFLRLLTFFKAMTQYAGFLFIPYQLRVERQMPWAQSLMEWDVLFGGIIVVTMLFCLFKFWRAKPLVSFGCAWFFIAIAPASNVLVPINSTLYEHFLYMPMIGIMLIVVYTFQHLSFPRKRESILKDGPPIKNTCLPAGRFGGDKLKIITLILILIIFCSINIHRNRDWHTAVGFYEQLVQYAPSYRVINNLGMEYANKDIHDKAELWYNKAITMDPSNPVGYHNVAGTYRDTGRVDLAEATFKRAISLNPKFIFSYRSLADLYWRKKNYPEAKKYIEVLVNFDPGDQNARGALEEINKLIVHPN